MCGFKNEHSLKGHVDLDFLCALIEEKCELPKGDKTIDKLVHGPLDIV